MEARAIAAGSDLMECEDGDSTREKPDTKLAHHVASPPVGSAGVYGEVGAGLRFSKAVNRGSGKYGSIERKAIVTPRWHVRKPQMTVAKPRHPRRPQTKMAQDSPKMATEGRRFSAMAARGPEQTQPAAI